MDLATSMGNLEWNREHEFDPEVSITPHAHFYTKLDKGIFDLGQHTTETHSGPRQAVFIRVLNGNGEETDFFDEFDLPSDRKLFISLYEAATRNIKGTDQLYESLLKELLTKTDEIPF